MEKTPKQKCIEMWEWLVENPGRSKLEYYNHLCSLKREEEYASCWACEFCDRTCENCPVKWNNPETLCMLDNSPYKKWCFYSSKCSSPLTKSQKSTWKKKAKAVLEIIKNTWED